MTRRPIDFKLLRDQIAPYQVLFPADWREIRWAGQNRVGLCPLCGGGRKSNGCFLVGSRVAKCMRCGWFGDALALYQALHMHPVYEAALALCDALGIQVPYIDRPFRHG